MLRATEILRAGLWNAKPADVVRLDYDHRTRRRIALTGAGGLTFLLDLAKAPVLAAGDGLRLEDGRIVAVEAAPERLLEIACRDERALARIAWHLGNRHLATEIGARLVYIRDDHVIAEMARGLGAEVRTVERPFNPEGGAYGQGAAHEHHHRDGHGHHDDHGHSRHDHTHDHGRLTPMSSDENSTRVDNAGRCAGTTSEAPNVNGTEPFTLSRLMIWLSPAYPVGGFSYSHGLEWTVETGKVRDAATLADWIEDILGHGAGRSDAVFLVEAWRAVTAGDERRLAEVAELAAAFAPSAERRLETLAQGAAFLAATQAVWPSPAQATVAALAAGNVAYPVAVGACAAAHGLPLAPTAQAFMQAFAAGLVSAGVRLIPLGQTDGLRVLARLEPQIPALVAGALDAGLDHVGGAAAMADIASMRHETQYTRLFRS